MIEIIKTTMAELLSNYNSNTVIAGYISESKCDAVPDNLNLNTDLYDKLERNGMLFTFGAYNGDMLVGALIVTVYELPKYSQLAAGVEILYLLPEYRSGGTGLKLIRLAEQVGVVKGATTFFLPAPLNGTLDKIAERSLRMTKTHVVYSKRIGEG